MGTLDTCPRPPDFLAAKQCTIFVYLAQRRSQEFCCEPNFGGACPRPPPSWLRQCVCPIYRRLHAAATGFFCGPGGQEVPISRSRRPPGAAAARRPAANASSVTLSASLGSCTHTFINFLCDFYRAMLFIRGTSHGPVSVRPSVRHKSVFYTKTAKRRITQTTPHDSPGTLIS